MSDCADPARQPPFSPALGRGASQQPRSIQNRSARSGSKVKQIGEGYCVCEIEHERMGVAEVDADYWKTWLSQRLSTPREQPGAMTLFQAPPSEHLAVSGGRETVAALRRAARRKPPYARRHPVGDGVLSSQSGGDGRRRRGGLAGAL